MNLECTKEVFSLLPVEDVAQSAYALFAQFFRQYEVAQSLGAMNTTED